MDNVVDLSKLRTKRDEPPAPPSQLDAAGTFEVVWETVNNGSAQVEVWGKVSGLLGFVAIVDPSNNDAAPFLMIPGHKIISIVRTDAPQTNEIVPAE